MRKLAGRPPPAKKRKAPPPPDWGERFLVRLAETRNVSQACEAVGIGRRTAYDRRDRDEAFQAAWDDAVFVFRSDLKATALRLAIEGYSDPLVVQEFVRDEQGRQQRVTRLVDRRRYDTHIIRFLLEKLLPGEFGSESSGDGDDKYRRAQTIAELVEAMRGSVPTQPDANGDEE